MQLAIEQNFNSRYPDQELKTIPDSDRTSKFLKQCAFIAKAMGNDYIGTEHMVLAAVTEEHSLLWQEFPLTRLKSQFLTYRERFLLLQ